MVTKPEFDYSVHPGAFVKDFLECYGMTQIDLSKRLGVSLDFIQALTKGEKDVDENLAKGLEKVFDSPADFWLSLQDDYNSARKSEKKKFLITGDTLFESNCTANQIADRFICLEHQKVNEIDGAYSDLTPLKLQKLLYFAQREAVKKGFIMFSDPIEHWSYGPVVPTVYERFKGQKDPIMEVVEDSPLTDYTMEEIVKDTYAEYGKYTVSHLVEESHREKPWVETKKGEIITPERIRDSL